MGHIQLSTVGSDKEIPIVIASSLIHSFSLTLNCWTEVIDERPTFSDLVNDISCILESVAGYVDFNFIQMV